MKYQLINKDIKNKSLLEIIYENRKITKETVNKLLNANDDDYRNPFEVSNMKKTVDFFQKIIKKDDLVVGLLIDEDVRLTVLQVLQFYING